MHHEVDVRESLTNRPARGYLPFPDEFTREEMKALTDEVPRWKAGARTTTSAKKGIRRSHEFRRAHYSKPFAKLARHPRMVQPVIDLFDEEVYMHQFKINGKMAFEGDVWQWHQDYGTWLNDDLMPTERATNVAIFLE